MTYQIGLIGASWIAPQAIIDPASILPDARIAGVAGRDVTRTQAYAATHAIPRVYDDYDALLADAGIDIVYISLPPGHHAHWTIRSLKAGKHVICEKPFAMNLTEAQAMLAASEATGKQVFEAFHCYHHPAFQTALEWVRSGQLGQVRSIRGHFGVGLTDDGIKNQYRPELGGGTIMDMGCYPLFWARQIAGTDLLDAEVQATVAPSGVDDTMSAELLFDGDITARISSGMTPETPFEAHLEVVGDRARIAFQNPLVPHQGGTLSLTAGGETQDVPVSTIPTYAYQLRDMLRSLANDPAPRLGADDILAQQRGIDLLYEKAGLGHLRRSVYFEAGSA